LLLLTSFPPRVRFAFLFLGYASVNSPDGSNRLAPLKQLNKPGVLSLLFLMGSLLFLMGSLLVIVGSLLVIVDSPAVLNGFLAVLNGFLACVVDSPAVRDSLLLLWILLFSS
jgi:hypothetical protein